MVYTGYKQRTQIANALKTRSHAIQGATKAYNNAASRLPSPRQPLDVQAVLKYVYLGEFELLRDSRFCIQDRQWAQAAEREAANAHYKLRRSYEELERLQVEARRMTVFMDDDEATIATTVLSLKNDDELVVHQLAKRLQTKVLINQTHRMRIASLLKLDGFSGSVVGECEDVRSGFVRSSAASNNHIVAEALVVLHSDESCSDIGEGEDEDESASEQGSDDERTDTVDRIIEDVDVAECRR